MNRTSADVTIAPLVPEDWTEAAAIYRQGIDSGNATFELTVPDWPNWDRAHLASCRLMARDRRHAALGWAALVPFSSRPVYRGVAEVSIYVGGGARGRGVGRALLAALVEAAEQEGIWTLQAGVFPENEASLALHLGHGFRVVGRRERIGRSADGWRDVVLLERRSARIGTQPTGAVKQDCVGRDKLRDRPRQPKVR